MANERNVCIVVLGDIGRSPRMQYHAISLAKQGHMVDIICYQETRPSNAVTSQPLISCHYLPPYPNIPGSKYINYVFKTIWQAISLMFLLFIIRRPHVLLTQNPPAVPSLLVCWIFAVIRNVTYVIDWHNYAYTIMALSVGKNNLLVRVTKKLEMFIGCRAQYNLCVTNEMKKDLKENWNINAVTLYDRPPDVFHPISLTEKHEIINTLAMKYYEFSDPNNEGTVFTRIDTQNHVSLKPDRPGLLVSSTSWTDDEDFSVLFKALQDYEDHIKDGNNRKLPKLICIITGKGPLKNYYCKLIKERNWQYVQVITPWLEAADYPLILASADLGVSLHTSSSGLDLPMKVVDMFGCDVPVCAYNYRSLHELVKHNKNSFTFSNSEELSQQIQDWFDNFPNNEKQITLNNRFKCELEQFRKLRWQENWENTVSHIFL